METAGIGREEFSGICLALRLLVANALGQQYAGKPDDLGQIATAILAAMDEMSYPNTPGSKGEMVKHHAIFFAETVLEGAVGIAKATR